MSIQRIYPIQDAFIAQELLQNTGKDEILKLGHCNVEKSTGPGRILMTFDQMQIREAVVGKENVQITLHMFVAKRSRIPSQYSIEIYKLQENWIEGIGKSVDVPVWTSDVSWTDRYAGAPWTVPGGTISDIPVTVIPFSGSDGDIRVNLTSQILNEGLYNILLKFSDEDRLYDQKTTVSFYSSNTHTIYSPYLEIISEDSKFEPTLPVATSSYVVTALGMYEKITKGDVVDIRIGVHPQYPVRTFSTASLYLDRLVLPGTSYWGIKDSHTTEMMVDFSQGTKISADSFGSYFRLDTSILPSERYMDLLIKVEDEGQVNTKLVHTFKVVRSCRN